MVFLIWDAYDASLVVVGIIIVHQHSEQAPARGCHPLYVKRPLDPSFIPRGAIVVIVGRVGILGLCRG